MKWFLTSIALVFVYTIKTHGALGGIAVAVLILCLVAWAKMREKVLALKYWGKRYEDVFIIKSEPFDLPFDNDLVVFCDKNPFDEKTRIEKLLSESGNNLYLQQALSVVVLLKNHGERINETQEEFQLYVIEYIRESRVKAHSALSQNEEWYIRHHHKLNV